MSSRSNLPPTPHLRKGASTAIRPRWPSGNNRPVPIASPADVSATTWTQSSSSPSHSSDSGTCCSSTKTWRLIERRVSLASPQRTRRTLSDGRGCIGMNYNQPPRPSRLNRITIMQSLWHDDEASEYRGDLAQRVYTSRLLGRDKTLVLHGGGN